MKNLKSLILTASVFAVIISSAHALPSWKGGQPLEVIRTKGDVDRLGAKSQLVLVCKASNSITLINPKDEKRAKEMCAAGTMIECKSCKRHYKVVWTNPTGKTGGPELKMDIVNDKGESCMFLAKLK